MATIRNWLLCSVFMICLVLHAAYAEQHEQIQGVEQGQMSVDEAIRRLQQDANVSSMNLRLAARIPRFDHIELFGSEAHPRRHKAADCAYHSIANDRLGLMKSEYLYSGLQIREFNTLLSVQTAIRDRVCHPDIHRFEYSANTIRSIVGVTDARSFFLVLEKMSSRDFTSLFNHLRDAKSRECELIDPLIGAGLFAISLGASPTATWSDADLGRLALGSCAERSSDNGGAQDGIDDPLDTLGSIGQEQIGMCISQFLSTRMEQLEQLECHSDTANDGTRPTIRTTTQEDEYGNILRTASEAYHPNGDVTFVEDDKASGIVSGYLYSHKTKQLRAYRYSDFNEENGEWDSEINFDIDLSGNDPSLNWSYNIDGVKGELLDTTFHSPAPYQGDFQSILSTTTYATGLIGIIFPAATIPATILGIAQQVDNQPIMQEQIRREFEQEIEGKIKHYNFSYDETDWQKLTCRLHNGATMSPSSSTNVEGFFTINLRKRNTGIVGELLDASALSQCACEVEPLGAGMPCRENYEDEIDRISCSLNPTGPDDAPRPECQEIIRLDDVDIYTRRPDCRVMLCESGMPCCIDQAGRLNTLSGRSVDLSSLKDFVIRRACNQMNCVPNEPCPCDEIWGLQLKGNQ